MAHLVYNKKISIDISGLGTDYGDYSQGGLDICGEGHIFAGTGGTMCFDKKDSTQGNSKLNHEVLKFEGASSINEITSTGIKIVEQTTQNVLHEHDNNKSAIVLDATIEGHNNNIIQHDITFYPQISANGNNVTNIEYDNIQITQGTTTSYKVTSREDFYVFVDATTTSTTTTDYYGNPTTTSTTSYKYKISDDNNASNAIVQRTFQFIIGKTYRFIQSDTTNVGHPLRFYTNTNQLYSYEVSNNGVPGGNPGGYTEITIDENTNFSNLIYGCSNHLSMAMGASITKDTTNDNVQTSISSIADFTIEGNSIPNLEMFKTDTNNNVYNYTFSNINADYSLNFLYYDALGVQTEFVRPSTNNLNISYTPGVTDSYTISFENGFDHATVTDISYQFSKKTDADISLSGKITIENQPLQGDLNDISYILVNGFDPNNIDINVGNTYRFNHPQSDFYDNYDFSFILPDSLSSFDMSDISFNVASDNTYSDLIVYKNPNFNDNTSLNNNWKYFMEAKNPTHPDLSTADSSFNIKDTDMSFVLPGEYSSFLSETSETITLDVSNEYIYRISQSHPTNAGAELLFCVSYNVVSILRNDTFPSNIYSGGSGMAFDISGHSDTAPYDISYIGQGQDLTFYEGITYRFHQSNTTNVGLPIKFYLQADKYTEWLPGVVYSRQHHDDTPKTPYYTDITVTSGTPAILYYQCGQHSYMGGKIIVNTYSDDKEITHHGTPGTSGAYTEINPKRNGKYFIDTVKHRQLGNITNTSTIKKLLPPPPTETETTQEFTNALDISSSGIYIHWNGRIVVQM